MPTLAPNNGHNWTDHERTEIGRLEAACHTADHWDLECSHTDEGDPWCIIYDRRYQRIVLHIARIDRRYIVVFPLEGRSAWTVTMTAAVGLAIMQIELTAGAR